MESRISPPDELPSLFAQADQDTRFYSSFGLYRNSEAYVRIIEDHGELALPALLEAISRDVISQPEENTTGWWALTAVGEIAQKIGRPFSVPSEPVASGFSGFNYEEVRDFVLQWGQEQGYLEAA
jgi:hypothetical protein